MSIELAAGLNNDCRMATDRPALERELFGQGEVFFRRITEHCPHLFAAAPLFVAASQLEQMRGVIAAVERAIKLPGWRFPPMPSNVQTFSPDIPVNERNHAKGVFMGYDFHLNNSGAHLIEINTNAGGAFLNGLLLCSQRDVPLPGTAVALDNLEQVFLGMFGNEWRMERGDAPLQTVAIVDENPEAQYLYPEFLLAQRMFERAGVAAPIADPGELEARPDGLYCREQKVDLVYNRLTDFMLEQHPALRSASLSGQIVLTPHPACYARYADKRNLAALTDAGLLRGLGLAESDIAALQAGVPETRSVREQDAGPWWQQRKQWFFKPASGFGSKGAYRGDKLTRRVFEEILQGGYVAQKLAAPGERTVCLEGEEPVPLKFDVRCYVYCGQIQVVAARLYQGQTTNFRTRGGGFAQVRIVV
ncbi:MAG: hypothetical protein FD134_1468 [Gallionellaceae bacterium]|nr:MAG: hypothetical protein FD134_1468 [Gallionellaceae bacterium]